MRIRGNFCLTEIDNESIESRIIVHVINTVVAAATWHYQKGISDLRNKDLTGAQYPIRRSRDFCQGGGGGVQMLYISKETHKICDFSGGSEATISPLDQRTYPIALNFGLGPSNWRKCPQTQWLLNALSTFYVKLCQF